MRIITSMFFVIGFRIVGSAMFRALGKARPPFILSLSPQVLLLISFVPTLPSLLGSTDGVWLAFPLADALSCLVTFFFYRRELRYHPIAGANVRATPCGRAAPPSPRRR